ncbi:endo-1,4-beta-xylanase [Parapedobacter koreensis]|uniref:Beta-xylanase n=1 Tax=Parapedobacter koreensis TaxID=332977 RepID=A0A1H7JTB5_9SPHI|nr:endo-1,4-beta-xylanase [Parapedobacter koreensis]SEK77566.1 endo-1,4-beta-xylanase [Parapedobacter koreensis]
MKRLPVFISLLALASTSSVRPQPDKGLKDYYAAYFPIGVAVNPRSLDGEEAAFIQQHFNSVTAENAMKMGPLQPKEGVFNWELADDIVAFAASRGMRIRGHALCWHQQVADWFFVDDEGQPVSREILLERLRTHIHTVMKRYKGKVYAWDVVNEAIDDNPENLLRPSKWTAIIGEDFVEKAFEFAHEADPDAKLFYNDYNSERPEKVERIYTLLKRLKDKNVPIHGVGLQAHWSVFEPSEDQLRYALDRFSSLGLELHITELDVSVYPWEKERRSKRADESDVYTEAMQKAQAEKYAMAFRVFRDYRDVLTSVTFWNANDRYTWLDNYPVAGRKNHPSLFDTQRKPKRAYWRVVDF